jgi:hypothetical protein
VGAAGEQHLLHSGLTEIPVQYARLIVDAKSPGEVPLVVESLEEMLPIGRYLELCCEFWVDPLQIAQSPIRVQSTCRVFLVGLRFQFSVAFPRVELPFVFESGRWVSHPRHQPLGVVTGEPEFVPPEDR